MAVGLFAPTLAGMNGFYYAAIALIPLLLAALLSRGAREFLWVGLALLGWDSWRSPVRMGYILASRRVGVPVPGQGGLAVAFLLAAAVVAPFAAAVVAPFGARGVATILDSPGLLALAALTAVLASLIPYSFELVALRSLP
ncbi:MAG: EamA family transporter, partial [Corynebacterium sp.]|nr:EamA family transporter [Corynebacterium sp.]